MTPEPQSQEPEVQAPVPGVPVPLPEPEPEMVKPSAPTPVKEMPEPVAEPVVEVPAPEPEPVVETPAPEPEPVIEAPEPEPVVEAPEPVVEAPVEEETVEPVQEPVVEEPAAEPEAPAEPEPVPGVDTVLIRIFELGDGPVVEIGDTVYAYYIGKLQSTGEVFDENVGGDPFSFVVGEGRVIRAWDEGFVGLPQGTQAEIVAPPQFAYGDRNIGNGLIPPQSTLVFTIVIAGVNEEPNFTVARSEPEPQPEQPEPE